MLCCKSVYYVSTWQLLLVPAGSGAGGGETAGGRHVDDGDHRQDDEHDQAALSKLHQQL